MSADKPFTKENLDGYLKELAKEFRKKNGARMPAEIIMIGGASILINFSSLSFFTSTLKPHPADAIYTVRYSHNTRSVRRLCQGSLCQDRFPFQGLPIF